MIESFATVNASDWSIQHPTEHRQHEHITKCPRLKHCPAVANEGIRPRQILSKIDTLVPVVLSQDEIDVLLVLETTRKTTNQHQQQQTSENIDQTKMSPKNCPLTQMSPDPNVP